MSIFLKRISLMLLLMVLVGGCAKKLPPQVSEGKAFSDQPYVVQGNIQYSILDYRYGSTKGEEPVNGDFVSIKLLLENIGSSKEQLARENFTFIHDRGPEALDESSPENLVNKELKPGEKLSVWLIFSVSEMPKGKKQLSVKDAKINIP